MLPPEPYIRICHLSADNKYMRFYMIYDRNIDEKEKKKPFFHSHLHSHSICWSLLRPRQEKPTSTICIAFNKIRVFFFVVVVVGLLRWLLRFTYLCKNFTKSLLNCVENNCETHTHILRPEDTRTQLQGIWCNVHAFAGLFQVIDSRTRSLDGGNLPK